jgi:hypothetical protein
MLASRLVGAAIAVAAIAVPASARAQAVPADPGETRATAFGPVVAPFTFSGAMETENDLDYFFVNVPRGSHPIHVTLTNTSTDTEHLRSIEVELVGPNGPALLNAGVGAGNSQTLDYTVAGPSRFYVLVDPDPFSAVGTPYTLNIAGGPFRTKDCVVMIRDLRDANTRLRHARTAYQHRRTGARRRALTRATRAASRARRAASGC